MGGFAGSQRRQEPVPGEGQQRAEVVAALLGPRRQPGGRPCRGETGPGQRQRADPVRPRRPPSFDQGQPVVERRVEGHHPRPSSALPQPLQQEPEIDDGHRRQSQVVEGEVAPARSRQPVEAAGVDVAVDHAGAEEQHVAGMRIGPQELHPVAQVVDPRVVQAVGGALGGPQGADQRQRRGGGGDPPGSPAHPGPRLRQHRHGLVAAHPPSRSNRSSSKRTIRSRSTGLISSSARKAE